MIDLDCEKRNIRPFGYWLRRDGKVISDIRANWWLKRDITNKETNCCPKELEWLYSCFAGEETAEGCTDQRAISAVCEDDNVPVCAE